MYVQEERSKGIDDDISAALLLSAHQYHRLDESLPCFLPLFFKADRPVKPGNMLMVYVWT